ncbi:MAG: DUF1156 domain-containing protein [Actinomycetales bacterium]|nr:DUF1156 domain-containing protein [Actinomycetales bacterium]
MTRKKKLIEVALPLPEINAACKADKDRNTGTIRNLHKWFAPMPLPAWRALLFAALVDDPVEDNQRVYLLDLVKRLVKNGADQPDHADLAEARKLLSNQFPGGVPTVMDPFCGGGSTLVEAQRLGLPSVGSDLNPVPALISRTLTQVLPLVHGREPLHEPASDGLFTHRSDKAIGYQGLATDVLHYAHEVERRAWEKLAPNFPHPNGREPIAWVWSRTAKCPNPACAAETLLMATWWLSKKKGDLAWFEPDVSGTNVQLRVVQGKVAGSPPPSAKVGDGEFACLACSATLNGKYLRAEGKAGRLGLRMVCVVTRDGKRRDFAIPTPGDVGAARLDVDRSVAEVPLNPAGQGIRVGLYGMNTWDKLFTDRQIALLTVFSDMVASMYDEVLKDGGDEPWAVAVTTMLGLAVGRLALSNSSQARVTTPADGTTTRFNAAFARNDLAMTWDFPEMYAFGGNGTWLGSMPTVLRAMELAPSGSGVVARADARAAYVSDALVATDPPYFDAIGYADLSDYFYVWHRRALRSVHPDLYITVSAPKTGELTAIPSHHGGKDAAREYFISGFTEAFANLKMSLGDGLPMVVVYASKEQKSGGGEEGRWSSILTAMIDADLEITGTWPIHGTGTRRMVGIGTNAIATYIALVCRPRPEGSITTSLSEFTRSLRRELAPAIRDLQAASILPVDLAQAAMGPGMQIFSRYRAVLDQSGHEVSVGQALGLINAALAEVLEEQEGELEPESRFAVRWWEAHGWGLAGFGEADKTARPLGISVDHVKRAQVAASVGNKLQLLGCADLDRSWLPSTDIQPTAWEAVHHLADRLINGGGELEAARLMATLGSLQDPAMALTYRLHDIAARTGRTSDQERYNALINSWAELVRLAGDGRVTAEGLF